MFVVLKLIIQKVRSWRKGDFLQLISHGANVKRNMVKKALTYLDEWSICYPCEMGLLSDNKRLDQHRGGMDRTIIDIIVSRSLLNLEDKQKAILFPQMLICTLR